MPLAFESLSQGTIAFGFFNIETDLLLLEHYFFFADDFCRNIARMSESPTEKGLEDVWQIYYIAKHQEIGDLAGAINDIRYVGFIGDVYQRFPFPAKTEDFKQNPDGTKTRSVVEEILQAYAKALEIKINVAPEDGVIEIGSYRFSWPSFLQLIQYVWRGGYPRWKDEIRPEYVVSMKNALTQDPEGLFSGIVFED
jgi:hypothetical protein